MPRKPTYSALWVCLNNRLVGHLNKAASGAITFQYDQAWLDWEHVFPVSLSLPLRQDSYRGEAVVAVFDNLLPDSDALRKRVATRVGAAGADAYSLLAAIGHDCVGALQFLDADEALPSETTNITGEAVDEAEIEQLLNGLVHAPLGLGPEDDFRISVAGAHEKTALLFHEGKWWKPHGTTPTTHILKTQIGRLPNGIDLSNSIENEYYCLKLAAAFGLPAAKADMQVFGATKALVIKRFDRLWAGDGRLLRMPQEDFCQALSVPPTRKYQSEGGPNLVQLLDLLKGSDNPLVDQRTLLEAQVFFWLIGATDGHAKNFSIFLGEKGAYRLTPLYDVLTAQPSLVAHQIQRKQMSLAMSVGKNMHYRIDEIQRRHFGETVAVAGLSSTISRTALRKMVEEAEAAMNKVEAELPADFPMEIHQAVKEAVNQRLPILGQ